MSVEDLAAKGVKKIAIHYGQKMKKKGNVATEIPKSEPIYLKNTQDDLYNVGFAKRVTMPEDVTKGTYWVAGYKSGQRATGVIDPMTVSAMWIDCKDNGGIVMVSADCVGLTGYEVSLVRNSLADFSKATGCKSISISCTHTHAGIDTVGYWGKTILGPIPGDGKDPEFMKMFLCAIRDVCVEAYEQRKEGKLYLGSAHVPEAQFDCRPPEVLHDVLTRIRFVPNDGSDETWFLNFAAHPNTLGGKNTEISADYPCYIRKTINESKPTNVLFAVGAIAAVDAGHYSEDRYERTVMEGEALGKAALAIDNDVLLKPEMTVVVQPYYSPVDNGVLALMGIINTVTSFKNACAYDKGELGIALKTEMTYIKLGSQQILMIPGESLPEFAHGGYVDKESSATGKGSEINPTPLTDVAKDENLLIFGVTNDMTGYMVPPNDFVLHQTQAYLNNGKDVFDRNHYHETNSLGFLTTQTVSDTFADIIARIR